jgi:hypothetical protein
VERLALPAVDIRIAGRAVPSETLFAYAGAFQLTLSTALPDEGVQLHSSYLGHESAAHTSASHLLIAPRGRPRLWAVEHDPANLPVMYARRHCLLDHLAVLADELRQRTNAEVLVDVAPEALERIDHA